MRGTVRGRILDVFLAVALLPGIVGTAVAQERRALRVIAPELIAPPPVDPATLDRADPRAPLSPLAGPAPEPKAKARDTRYFRPVAIAAGMFESEGKTVTIAGIRVIAPDRTCDAAAGGVWPCGTQARTAFRYWLRGRAVECDPGGDGEEAGIGKPMACSLAGYDIGKWLTENGWALAEPGGPYEEQTEAARQARKGIFGGGPTGS